MQLRVISLKLNWNIFKLNISKMISAEMLPGLATPFTKSTIQPSYVDIPEWIHAFAFIFFKAIDVTSKSQKRAAYRQNERNLGLGLTFKKYNKLELAVKNANLTVSNLPFTTPKI